MLPLFSGHLTILPTEHSMSNSVTPLNLMRFSPTRARSGNSLGAPFLFSMYTADCRFSHTDCVIDKYADDTVLTGLIADDDDDDDEHYKQEIDSFVQWCERNYLQLHVGKIREMIMDFCRNNDQPAPVVIRGEAIDRVAVYQYLGIYFDGKLNRKQNTDAVLKKAHTGLFCLRKPKSFKVRHELLQIFYASSLSIVLTFGLSSWSGNTSKYDRGAVDKIIRKARSGEDTGHFRYTIRQTGDQQIDEHTRRSYNPLRLEFDERLIPRSGRMRVPRARTTRYLTSFVPQAVFRHSNLM